MVKKMPDIAAPPQDRLQRRGLGLVKAHLRPFSGSEHPASLARWEASLQSIYLS
jgi:hypothetical protein